MGAGQQSLLIASGSAGSIAPNLFNHKGTTLSAGNNNPISTWTDSSAAGNNLSNSGGFRPTQIDGVLNGNPIARYSGSNIMNLSSAISLQAPFTHMAVMKFTSTGIYTIMGGQSGCVQVRINNRKIGILKQGLVGIGESSTSLSTGTFYIIAVTYDGSTAAFYVNGSADGTASSSQTFTGNVLYQGRNDGSEWFVGDIAEDALWNSVLTSGQLAAAFSGMNATWAVY